MSDGTADVLLRGMESPLPHIRPLTPADESEWRRLWTAYLAFYEATIPEAVYRTTFARLLSDDPTVPRGLVAEGEGTYSAERTLPAGQWIADIASVRGGQPIFHQTIRTVVAGGRP